MTATVDDIAAATRPSSFARWTDSAIKARYPSARDGSTSPREGFFDALADAQAAVDQEGDLLGTERRRFTAKVDGLVWLDPSLGTPTIRLIDAEQGVDGNFLGARIEVDLESETTTLELFG